MFETHYYVKRITKTKNKENMKKAAIELITGMLGVSFVVFMTLWTLGEVWFWVFVALCYCVWFISILIKRDRNGFK